MADKQIWEALELPAEAKLRLHSAGVVAVLTHGYETWSHDAKVLSSLEGWCARCLCRTTGRELADMVDVDTQPSTPKNVEHQPRRLRWAGPRGATLLARAKKCIGEVMPCWFCSGWGPSSRLDGWCPGGLRRNGGLGNSERDSGEPRELMSSPRRTQDSDHACW